MNLLIFILKIEIVKHKLKYSKTVKADFFGAFLGLGISLIAAYLTLSSVGAASVDMYDLTIVLYYSALFTLICSLM